jgi:hypothetical protein
MAANRTLAEIAAMALWKELQRPSLLETVTSMGVSSNGSVEL